MKKPVFLTLEDGSIWKGYGKIDEPIEGEVVFTTSAGGYPQILTDPSYCKQIIVFAFPPTGIYGVDTQRLEGQRPWVSAALCSIVDETRDGRFLHLSTWMQEKDTPLLGGFDTRQLILKLRKHGSLMGRLDTQPVAPTCSGLQNNATELVKLVSTETKEEIGDSCNVIAMVDYGIKENLIRNVLARNCKIEKYPHNVTAEEILNSDAKGVIIAGGPGSCLELKEGANLVKQLLGKLPYLGIGHGCTFLAMACGAEVYKMDFGHRGPKPVLDTKNGHGFQTSQNHQYCIREESLEKTDLEISFSSLADETIEGIKHKAVDAEGILFDPDASPGPEESVFVLENFIKRINPGRMA